MPGTATQRRDDRDDVSPALDAVMAALEANRDDERLLVRRVRDLREARATGLPWRDVLARERHPGVFELVGRIQTRFTTGTGALRRALARELRAEGAPITAIAERFGVSHQRVSRLLKRAKD